MSAGPTELLLLRLGLLAIVFVFLVVAALALRSGLSPRTAKSEARVAAGRREPRLVVVSPADTGLRSGVEIVLTGPMTVGRDIANGIVLADASVSGRHASIERDARGWWVRDLGSTNGTFVQGRPADGQGAWLRDGQTVTFGTVTFRYRSPAS